MVIVFARASKPRSLAAQVLLVQLVILSVVVLLAALMAYRQADRLVAQNTRNQVLDVAYALAADPSVVAAVRSDDPAKTLQPLADHVQLDTDTDFIVFMSLQGRRWTHPDRSLIGGRFTGTIAPATRGGEVVEDYVGSLGPSTRAVVPIRADGRPVALVSVGVRKVRARAAVLQLIPDMLASVAAVGLLSGAGAWFLVRRVRRQTLGLNARDIASLNDHHEAVLYAVREGLLIIGANATLQVINNEAGRLLGLDGTDVGRDVRHLGFSPALLELCRSTQSWVDQELSSRGRVLLVSSSPVRRGGRQVATVVTFRDRTELEAVTGELLTTKTMADALHAQAHESANRLHTVVSLIELGQPADAIAFATDELHESGRQRENVLSAIDEPAVAALLLGKVQQAVERGVRLEVDPDAHLPEGLLPSREVITILGNLIDNAVDALATHPDLDERVVTVDVAVAEQTVTVTVADTGPGIPVESRSQAFSRGWSSKPSDAIGGRGLGLALVSETVNRLGGSIEVSEPPGATFTVTLPVVFR